MRGLNIQGGFLEGGRVEIVLSIQNEAAVLTEEQALAVANVLVHTVEEMRKQPEYTPPEEKVTLLVVDYKSGSLLNFEGKTNES